MASEQPIEQEPTKPFDWAATRGDKWRAQLTGMEAMLAPINEPLIDALHLDVPMRIADVACGGGGTTLEILRRAPQGSRVHGVDISPGLIDTARGRAPRDTDSIAFTVADVATAPPPGGPYDRLVSRFGLMFFDDPPAAFANLARWLTPDGRCAFAVWGPPADNSWMTTVRDVVTMFIDVPPPVPDAPGPFRYSDVDTLLSLLNRAGLGGLQVTTWRGPLALGGGLSAADAATFALAAFSIAEPLTTADEATRAAAHRALSERFSQHLHDEVVRLDACVHIVTGGGAQ